jgi:uncharacterized membrane protein YqgA involved in biofilm formation
LWGTIVNAASILGGALLGTLIHKGFTKRIMLTGAGVLILAVTAAALIGGITGQYNPALVFVIGAALCLLWLAAGFFLRKGLPEAYSNIIMQGIGLSVVVIGITNALETKNMLLVIMSLVIGGIAGQAAGIEKRLDAIGEYAQRKMGNGENSTISQGFVTASLIFCVGAMAIVGSLDAGMKGDYVTLYAKSMLDGITSIVLASTLGIGVAFSAAAVFVYQGAVTLASGALYPFLSEMVIGEMSAVGGILIIGIGFSMLGMKKFNIGNLLPAILVPPLYFPIAGFIAGMIEFLR